MPLSSHAKRLTTAFALLPLLLFVIFAGGWWVFAGALAASWLGLYEFYGLFWPRRQGMGKKLIGFALAGLVFLAAKLQNPGFLIAVLLLSFWAGNLFFLFCYSRRPSETFYSNSAVLLTGLFYLPLTLQFFLFFGPAETFLVLLATFISDTGAYYAGSHIGGPKIWPSISPKKTWAGSLGGMAACVAVTVAFGLWFGEAGFWPFVLLGVVLSISAQLGDFFESALKRWLGVKDSGTLLPGHGGMLDRIDGLLLATPIYAAVRALHPFFAS